MEELDASIFLARRSPSREDHPSAMSLFVLPDGILNPPSHLSLLSQRIPPAPPLLGLQKAEPSGFSLAHHPEELSNPSKFLFCWPSLISLLGHNSTLPFGCMYYVSPIHSVFPSGPNHVLIGTPISWSNFHPTKISMPIDQSHLVIIVSGFLPWTRRFHEVTPLRESFHLPW